MKIDQWYKKIMANLALQEPEVNKRTGVAVKAIPGVTYRTDLEKEGFPLLSLRKLQLSFVPEVMWFLSASDNVRPFLERHTKIWSAFAEEDGTVTSAYGKRWDRANQLWRAISGLQDDHSTRHAVVVTWDHERDCYGQVKQKNVPCPVMFTLNVIGGRLHMHVVVRSNDMVLGFPTDVAGFAFLQMIIAQYLGVRPGVYTHSISNCHYYVNQDEAVREMMSRPASTLKVQLELPKDACARASRLDETLIADVKEGLFQYEPHAAIKNIPIAI